MSRRQKTVRFDEDVWRQLKYYRDTVSKQRRTKVSMQSTIDEVIAAGIAKLQIPSLPRMGKKE